MKKITEIKLGTNKQIYGTMSYKVGDKIYKLQNIIQISTISQIALSLKCDLNKQSNFNKLTNKKTVYYSYIQTFQS